MEKQVNKLPDEQQKYEAGGWVFIVDAVYKQEGETLGKILLRLMLESCKKP